MIVARRQQPMNASTKPVAKTALTKSQVEILRLVNRGLSNDEIAKELCITVGTVKWHLHRIYSQLRVRNRTAAAAKARELGII